MLFYSNILLDGAEIKVPLLASVHGSTGSESLVGIREMLGKKDTIGFINSEGYEIYLAALQNRVVPYLEEEKDVDLTALYNVYLENRTLENLFSRDMYSDFETQIADPNITADIIEKFMLSSKAFYEYLEEPTFRIEFDKANCSDVMEVSKVADTINNSLGDSQIISSSINRTSFMNTPEDKVFVMLPGMDDIKLESYILPDKEDVMIDYPVKAYNQDDFLKYLRSNADLPMITGNAENNSLPIQDNEKDFYDALCKLIQYGIQKDYPEMTLEQCEEAGISSKSVKKYLTILATTVAAFNWHHTGAYPDLHEVMDEEGDITVSENMYGGNYNDFTDFRDATKLLAVFMENVSAKNIYAPAEVIIKVLRWGDRKPTAIRIDGYPDEYILNTQMTKPIRLGISDCELAYNEGSEYTLVAPLGVGGMFGDTTYLRDLGVQLNVLQYPIGIVCHRYFVGKTEDTSGNRQTLSQTVVMTWLDVIEVLRENPNNIKGITYQNGEFKIDNLDPELVKSEGQLLPSAVSLIHSYNSTSQYIAYTSNRVLALTKAVNENYKGYSYIECLNKYIAEKNIVNDLGTFAVTSKAEMEELMIEGYSIQEVLSGRIAGAILPAIIKSLYKLQDIVMTGELTLEKSLNVFAVTEQEEPVDLELEDVEETRQMKSSINNVESKLKKLAFANEEVKEQKETKVEGNQLGKPYQHVGGAYMDGFMFSSIEPNENLKPLVIERDGGLDTVGYIVIREGEPNAKGKRSKIYVFAPKEIVQGNKLEGASNSVLVTGLIKIMLNDLYRISAGVGTPVCRFTDSETMKSYIKLIGAGKVNL